MPLENVNPEKSLAGDRSQASLPSNRIVRIIESDQMHLAHHWFIVTPKGKLSPSEILNAKTLGTAADSASEQGVCEEFPVLVSYRVENDDLPVSLFLISLPPAHAMSSQETRSPWQQSICSTIVNWNLGTIGLHFATSSLTAEQEEMLLVSMLKDLAAQSGLAQIFVCTNAVRYSNTLNSCILAKRDLTEENQKDSGFYIIH